MKLYFTARNNIGSRLIRWATDGDVSHVAVGFGGAVYHATEHGFVQQSFESFASQFTIVRALEFGVPDDEGALAFTAMVPKGARYDYSAFAYFAYRAFKKKFLGQPYPSKNLLNSRGFLCTEMGGVADKVSEILGYGSLLSDDLDLAMTSPIELYYLLEIKSERAPYVIEKC